MSVRVEHSGPVTTVILDRPERRNAVDRETADALAAAFKAFAADDSKKAAVLYGDGGSFCAGADLRAISDGNANRVEPDGDGPMGPTRLLLDKPVIGAIEGYAVAGGLELALWCDLRVAASDATFGVFCRRFGVPLIDGGTYRLPRLIGLSRALDLILTGRPVSAEEAEHIGLVNRVVEPGRARAAAEALALSLCAFPQACLRADRNSAYRAFELGLEQGLAQEFVGGVGALAAEGVSGAASFVAGKGRHGAQ